MKVIITKNSISKYFTGISKYFTGICKTLIDNSIRYFKYGLQHREDGPAHIYVGGRKCWYYKGIFYGYNDRFTVESWIEFLENKKREEQLQIFI
jgi:hypothetical protein